MATPQNNFEKLVNVYATEVQAVEAALVEVLLWAHIDPGDPLIVGDQLDGIGEIVGLAREGRDDTTYRARIRARILTNKSNGTPPDLIAITDAFLGGVIDFDYISEDDTIPAAFEIDIVDPLAFELGISLGLEIRAARAGGVRGYVIYQESIDAETFYFDGFNSAVFDYTDSDTNTGFGISGASGSTGTLDSATTDLTTELVLYKTFQMSGFTNAGNNGIYRCVGTPTASTAAVQAIDGRTLVNESAGASVTLETDGFGLRGAAG